VTFESGTGASPVEVPSLFIRQGIQIKHQIDGKVSGSGQKFVSEMQRFLAAAGHPAEDIYSTIGLERLNSSSLRIQEIEKFKNLLGDIDVLSQPRLKHPPILFNSL